MCCIEVIIPNYMFRFSDNCSSLVFHMLMVLVVVVSMPWLIAVITCVVKVLCWIIVMVLSISSVACALLFPCLLLTFPGSAGQLSSMLEFRFLAGMEEHRLQFLLARVLLTSACTPEL